MTDDKHITTDQAGPGPPGESEERRVDEARPNGASEPDRTSAEGTEAPNAGAPEGGQDEGSEGDTLTTEAEAQGEPDPLAEAERKRDEYLELAQRTQAEFENYRKRMVGELAAAAERGKGELATGLIEVVDNLERALEAIDVSPEAALDGAEVEGALAQGVVLTYRELCETLKRAGVEGLNPTGEKFDPTWHEAIQSLPAEGGESGVVIEVLQKGYRLGDRVLRPARVIVSA